MGEPAAIGVVLAMLVDRGGKPVLRGSGKGQLYASGDGLVVLRPTVAELMFHRGASVALLGSIAVVLANLVLWKSTAAIWIAVALQAAYWVTLPARRRTLEPRPLSAPALAAARGAGRAIVRIPAADIRRAVPAEPPRKGFRKPARFEVPDGALEVYLSDEQFRAAVAALGARPHPHG